MWGKEPTTFGDMEGGEVWKIEQKRVREEEERKNLYKFNIGDKIKVKEIAEIYKSVTNVKSTVNNISELWAHVKYNYDKAA